MKKLFEFKINKELEIEEVESSTNEILINISNFSTNLK